MNFLNKIFIGQQHITREEFEQVHSNLEKEAVSYNEPNTKATSGNISATSYYSAQDITPISNKLLKFSNKLELYLKGLFQELNFNDALYEVFDIINFHIYQGDLTNNELIQLIYKEQNYFKNFITENMCIYNEYIQRIDKLNEKNATLIENQKEFEEYNLMRRWLNEGMKVSDRKYKASEQEKIIQNTLCEVMGKSINIDKIKLNDFNMRQIKMKILDFEIKKNVIENKINLAKMLIIE